MTTLNDLATASTATHIYGYACPNDRCQYHQGLIVTMRKFCQLCGTELRAASVAAVVFRWEPESGHPAA